MQNDAQELEGTLITADALAVILRRLSLHSFVGGFAKAENGLSASQSLFFDSCMLSFGAGYELTEIGALQS